MTLGDVHASEQLGVSLHGSRGAICQGDHVGERGVGQGVRGGVRHCPGDVAHREWTTPCFSYVGLLWVVSWAVAMQPPWSIEISTITLPGRIAATTSSVTTIGAPGTRNQHRTHDEVRIGDVLLDRKA